MRPRLDLFYDKRYSHTKMTNPDFILLAQSMGVHAIKCRTAEELPAKMKEFLEYDGSRPVLMECLVEKNEHVFPMVRNQLAIFGTAVLINFFAGSRRKGSPRADDAPLVGGCY